MTISLLKYRLRAQDANGFVCNFQDVAASIDTDTLIWDVSASDAEKISTVGWLLLPDAYNQTHSYDAMGIPSILVAKVTVFNDSVQINCKDDEDRARVKDIDVADISRRYVHKFTEWVRGASENSDFDGEAYWDRHKQEQIAILKELADILDAVVVEYESGGSNNDEKA